MKLWKYVSLTTAEQILGNQTLRFSPILERKDHRGVPSYEPLLNDTAECDFDFTDEIARIEGGLSPYLSGSGDPRDTRERFIVKDIRQQIQANAFRIFSASLIDPIEKKANPLWGHYGASSQGVCLEIDQPTLIAALESDLKKGGRSVFQSMTSKAG